MFRITEFFQDLRSGFCYPDAMSLRVVGIAQQAQILVALFQQFVDFFVVFDIVICHFFVPRFSCEKKVFMIVR